MQKRYIYILGKMFPGTAIEVEARPVKEYPRLDFFYHRPVDEGGRQGKSGWVISEGSTGLTVMPCKTTQQKALEALSPYIYDRIPELIFGAIEDLLHNPRHIAFRKRRMEISNA